MIGEDCILGQISTLMDALHLSYREVVHEIPYRTLLLMQKDKLRPCYGVKVERVSGKDMAMRRAATK